MAAHKCMMFFFDQGAIWSETYYYVGNDLKVAMDALNLLAIARLPLISDPVILGKLRVSREPADRNVIEAGVPQAPAGPERALPWVSVVVEIYAQGGPLLRHYQRGMSLRGLPKDYCKPESVWPERFQKWLDTLVMLGFCMKVYNRDLPTIAIRSMGQVANEKADPLGDPILPLVKNPAYFALAITTREPHGITAMNVATDKPSLVKILGMRWKWPDGTVQNLFPKPLEVLGADRQALVVRAKLPDVGALHVPGKVRLAETIYLKFTRAKATYDPIRKTGGRSKVRPSVLPPWTPTRAFTIKIGHGSITEEYRPPPPFGPPEVPPEVVTHTIRNAYDLVRFTEEGYFPHDDGIKYQITIARVLNMDNTWLVVASGTDLSVDAATGITEDILAGIGAGDAYVTALWAAVKEVVPKGGKLCLAGDSLGGMEVQNLLKYLTVSGHKAINLVTFNSPQTTLYYFADHTVRFAEEGDMVIGAGIVGGMLSLLDNPEQTFLPEPAGFRNAIQSHRAIYTNLDLAEYDALGYGPLKAEGKILQLGKQRDFVATQIVPESDDDIFMPK